MAARDFLRNNWPAITITATAAAIACAAIVMLRGMPPRMIVMATGPEGGAYYEFGKRYQAELAAAKVRVRLMPTAGSLENLKLLRHPRSGVSVALIQGGTIKEEDSSELEWLLTVCDEALWPVEGREVSGGGFDSLRGLEVSIATEDSGTRALG